MTRRFLLTYHADPEKLGGMDPVDFGCDLDDALALDPEFNDWNLHFVTNQGKEHGAFSVSDPEGNDVTDKYRDAVERIAGRVLSKVA